MFSKPRRWPCIENSRQHQSFSLTLLVPVTVAYVIGIRQEYPTEPLDKIPALQAEFELAGKKKNLGKLAGWEI